MELTEQEDVNCIRVCHTSSHFKIETVSCHNQKKLWEKFSYNKKSVISCITP